jgi:hypothetical protein
MNNAKFRQARQSNPREGTARDHDAAGDTGELAISGFENGIRDERWQFDHAFAAAAQARPRSGDKGSAQPPADELFPHGERANGVSGLFKSAGGDRANGKEMKNFVHLLCDTKLTQAPPLDHENIAR